jgi:hypothetical protein
MNIGILKEEPSIERRVALSPAGVEVLKSHGHTIFVLHQTGSGVLLRDEDYQMAGATISYSSEEIINRSDIILKVSPPTDEELEVLREGQTFFSFLHLAVSRRKVLERILEKKVTAIAFELIENERGDLEVLQVMSEIAGQIAIQVGAISFTPIVADGVRCWEVFPAFRRPMLLFLAPERWAGQQHGLPSGWALMLLSSTRTSIDCGRWSTSSNGKSRRAWRRVIILRGRRGLRT